MYESTDDRVFHHVVVEARLDQAYVTADRHSIGGIGVGRRIIKTFEKRLIVVRNFLLFRSVSTFWGGAEGVFASRLAGVSVSHRPTFSLVDRPRGVYHSCVRTLKDFGPVCHYPNRRITITLAQDPPRLSRLLTAPIAALHTAD